MPRQQISSFQNSKIKLADKLVKKREREKEGLFVIDYARDLQRALQYGYEVEFAFYCDSLASDDDRELVQRLDDQTLVYEVHDELMDKASYRQNPGGLVAVMHQKPAQTAEDAGRVNSPHILGLVNLRKPGNIGALLRTADAAGIDMVFLVDMALDLYNPNITRSSTGANFADTIYQMSSLEARHYFQTHQVAVVAAHLAGTTSLYDIDFTAQRTAMMLGNEAEGLEDTWVTNSDELVKIPMMGDIADSLNVSVTGAVMMYEALRQRQHINQ